MYQRESANLDALRSLAVTLVLADHLIVTINPSYSRTPLGNYTATLGMLGVLMFFIHTSMVLMMSLARIEAGREPHPITRFYVRRIFRIYPLSIVTVLLIVALRIPAAPWETYVKPSVSQLWSNLLLVQNLTQTPLMTSQLWSLPFEVQMYLALPFIYLIGKRIGQPTLLIAIGFALMYTEYWISVRIGYVAIMQFAPWFFMGVSVYFRTPSRRLAVWAYMVSLALFVLIDLLAYRLLSFHAAAWVERACGIAFCFALPAFREIESLLARRAFHLIAKYSYGIYLSHFAIMWLAFKVLSAQNFGLRVLAFTVLMAIIPLMFYHIVEEPFIRLGVRIANTSRMLKNSI